MTRDEIKLLLRGDLAVLEANLLIAIDDWAQRDGVPVVDALSAHLLELILA